MKTVIATGNKNKVREMRQILGDLSENVISMEEAGIDCEIVENGDTFLKNALIKARTVKEHWDGLVVADDSGLWIDALGGDPGVMSSRYLGEDTPYEEKNKAILERLNGIETARRTARFVCAMAAILPDGEEICVEEKMEGIIADAPAGENGFGYDPIFFLPEEGCTSAELSPEAKNAISHRGKAVKELRKKLEEYRESLRKA